MSDTELWQAWRERGDAEAFTTLVERYLDMVYATARRILGNAHDAEDVAQDCFIALLKGRVTVQHPLGPWLHRVARNRALDKIKGESRRRVREQTFHDARALSGEPAIDDILEHVDAAIDALPADQRAAIIGRFLEGKTNQALGDELGVSESTIRHRIGKGVESIRATLKERGAIVTAAALGAVLESNLAGAAPAELRAAIGKLALATPAPAPPGRVVRIGRGALLAGLSAAVLGLLFAANAVLGTREPAAQVKETTAKLPAAVYATFEAPPFGVPVSTNVEVRQTQSLSADAVTAPATARPADVTKEEEPTSTVSGTIYDDRGHPLPGAIVTVVSHVFSYSPERSKVFTATTDENGKYVVEGVRHHKVLWGYSTNLRPGKEPIFSGLIRHDPPNLSRALQVWASASGYHTKGDENISVEPGDTKEGVDFMLSPGATVRGRVVWPDSQPVQYAAVILRGQRDADGKYPSEGREFGSTDADGQYVLGVHRSEGLVSLLVIAADGHAALFAHVPANEHDVPVLTMSPMAALSGTVVRADGTPLIHALVNVEGRFGLTENPDFARQVELRDSGNIGSAYNEGTYTDEKGSFAFPTLASVPDAVLHIDAPLLEYKGKSERLLSRDIGALVAGEPTAVDIVLQGADETMTLSVAVVGEQSGEPLPYTGVMLRLSENEMGISLNPDSESPYYPVERKLTEPGAYEVWPHYNHRTDGDERSLFSQEVKWEPGTAMSVTFRIPDPYSLSVLAVDPLGNPISGANVVTVFNDSGYVAGDTNENGIFRWGGFRPNAPGFMRVTKEGYSTNETDVVTGEPGVDDPEQTVVLYPTGGVEGRLVTEDGAAVTNIHISFQFTAETVSWSSDQETTSTVSTSVKTDADGNFVWLDGIPAVPGSLSATLYREGGPILQSGPVQVEVTAGTVLQLGDLVLQAAEVP